MDISPGISPYDSSDEEDVINTDSCAICDKDIDAENNVNVLKGLDTLLNVSIERNDGTETKFKNKREIRLHVKCRGKYITRKNQKLQYKNEDFGSGAAPNNIVYSSVKSKVRKSCNTFDFTNLCFICGFKSTLC